MSGSGRPRWRYLTEEYVDALGLPGIPGGVEFEGCTYLREPDGRAYKLKASTMQQMNWIFKEVYTKDAIRSEFEMDTPLADLFREPWQLRPVAR